MTTPSRKARAATTLRSRAVARLTGPSAQPVVRADASGALRVLFELASSPATAAGALALLHELQVHQVEVDLQEEELRRSRLELETSLNRHLQLYDHAPVGCFTLDEAGRLHELNRTGARLLGSDADFLKGRSLEGYLTPGSVQSLHRMLERLRAGAPAESAELQLPRPSGEPCRVHASACRDPAGAGFLLALMEVADAQRGSR